MPAGNYVFTQQDGQSLVSIESHDRHHFAFVLMNPMSAKDSKGTPTLVFDRVGTDHILAKVIAGGGAGRELVLTPAGIGTALNTRPNRRRPSRFVEQPPVYAGRGGR